ncbi:hypothetical protein COCCADRAFT_10178 [Bipolaris zeicola 26-R-13]|uniref:Rhodopsin domain-containing protein n=1 Tax=Cochliobolus carbonum (strain 26-R-13) TaxID=930089 RepID=W6XJ68_COCC2|nr:uncharacterized protein COCCADRAFT_10178 [Bipolaris zeicola 26-R-13]EUC27152.1 hypothetical protein COCCADRAFT_10178 [Bipolaris zeicola 26-R-13]
MGSPSSPQLAPERLAALQREDGGPLLISIVSVFTAVGCILVCLRIYARSIIIHNVGLEDYCIILSFAHAIAMAVFQIEGAKHGGSKHTMFLTLPQIEMTLKYLYGSILMYANALTLTKLSILLQYRRIFTFTSMRIPIYIVGAICLATGISASLVLVFSCIPISAFWDISEKETATCINSNVFSFAGAAMNIVTDILVAALPIRAIWQLQVSRKQRIALMCILTLGWCVCIISIARLHGFIELAKHPEDSTFYGTAPAYWSAIEVNLGIVCACAPALKPLVVKAIPRFATLYGSRKSTYGGTKDTPKDSASFVKLKDKGSTGTISDEIELHYRSGNVVSESYTGLPRTIHVKTDLEQQIDDVDCNVETNSERNIVIRPTRIMDRP